jgi:hypothetical protein
MEFENKKLRDVAEIAARIMLGQQPVTEKLHPNQQKLDVHEPEKDELTSDDFKKLRAGKKEVKKEEVEAVEEGLKDMAKKAVKVLTGGSDEDQRKDLQKKMGMPQTGKKPVKEEVELDEVKMSDLPSRKVQGRSYGASKPESDYVKGPSDAELKKIEAEKKKKKFSEMVDVYKTGGLKSFMESIPKEEELIDELSKDIAEYTMDVIDAGEYAEVTIGEEASQDEFNAEIKKAQAKSEGKEKAQVAKPFVQAVKQEEIEITDEMIFEMIEEAGIDFESLSDEQFQNVANEAYEIIKERQMTDSEMEKKEKIVKSMKKGLSGFKERYGDKAKNVMYATATKQAMKEEEESKHYKAGHEYASDHAQDAGFKVTARARKKEMLADNPHKKGTPEHSDWHRGANDGHQTALNNM